MAQQLGGRLPLRSPQKLQGQAREVYDRLTKRGGDNPPFRSRTDAGELIGPYNACIWSPAIGAAFLSAHEAEERATPLPARVREVIILSVGAVWGCAYELYAHRALAARAGLSQDAIDALASGQTLDGLSEDERTAQRFVLELTRDRRAQDATYAALEVAFGREGALAAIFLAGLYSMTATLLNALEVPVPDAV